MYRALKDRTDDDDERRPIAPFIWSITLLIWFIAICVIPDPRPLGAPDWAVEMMQKTIGLSEPGARAVATFVLRAIGMGLIGVLLSLVLAPVRFFAAAPIVVVGSALLAVASQWINYGYFPIYAQIQLGVISATLGSLVGLSLRRTGISLAALIVFVGGVLVWGASTGISDDLDAAARATGLYLLEQADEIPDGDEGFIELIRLAFTYAEDNSHRSDPVFTNQSAILALGVIIGEEKVARVAGREIDMKRMPEIKALYSRISVRGRNDLARHFWVSAALAVLSDESRSMTVGITKELMDATPGGSGFSFVDLTADRAGTLFTQAATRDAVSAKAMQRQLSRRLEIGDIFPEIEGLPEGIDQDAFQNEYGGLGGEKTNQVIGLMQERLSQCRWLEAGR